MAKDKQKALYNIKPINISDFIVKESSLGVNSYNAICLANYYNISKEKLSEILDISTKTLDRYYKSNKTLNKLNSEQMIKLAYLFDKGTRLFGSKENFDKWIHEPSYGLGGAVPIDLFTTITGLNMVIEELERLEYGDLS